ncbi:B3 domain-containing protein Os01g0905400-like [Benincasa hispida]|uniref:B3 domain-containing protein Os01g0905400-like n=1 Tax=Benincasa hispida TaxID=102211 RepID=UPI0018FF670F|nr:B3 domain-containing protein Os01g0905400-like [Benincasa hispida]XP_038894887.1 B3 domain-containing protein Os01g0905400-like [Benincasa hispida]XP_038894888.1 B3 domain-containing protein Os01g0905400-like [Benincasa hispida]
MSSKVEACPECTQRCLHLHRKTGNLSSVTSFFKVMFGDRFSEVLYFPPMFAATLSRLVDKKVVLEDSLGQQWKVTVSNCEGSLAFQEGWNTFSLDHSLEIGDFLIFNHVMDLHFDVSIYTKTGCEKIEFAKKSKMRKRTRSAGPVIETTNEGLTNPQASYPSVGSESNVALSQDKCNVAGYRNMNVNQDKRPKYWRNDEGYGPLFKVDVVDDSYCFINQNKDVGLEENRSPLLDLFSMEMQIVKPSINENTTNNVAQDELDPNCTSTSQNAAIIVSPVNNAPIDIRGNMEVLPLDISANKIIDKSQCFEEAEIKMSVSDNDPCHDKTIEVPFISSATNSEDVEHFCDTPLKMVKDCQNVPAICSTPSTITRHDQVSNHKCTSSTEHCRSVKQEYPPNSLEVKKWDMTKIIKKEPLEIRTEVNNCGNSIKRILDPKVIKKEFIVTSNQSGRDNNDDTNNEYPIGTPAHISCIIAKDTLSFLELPTSLHLSCSRGRRNPEKKKVVFLRDPRKRLWPILYHEMPNVKVLTSGWESFCSANKIQSGDECLFHVEDELERIYEVSVRKCKN